MKMCEKMSKNKAKYSELMMIIKYIFVLIFKKQEYNKYD